MTSVHLHIDPPFLYSPHGSCVHTSNLSSYPSLHAWCNKGHGMCYPEDPLRPRPHLCELSTRLFSSVLLLSLSCLWSSIPPSQCSTTGVTKAVVCAILRVRFDHDLIYVSWQRVYSLQYCHFHSPVSVRSFCMTSVHLHIDPPFLHSPMVHACIHLSSYPSGSSDRSFMVGPIELFLVPASAPRLSVGWCI